MEGYAIAQSIVEGERKQMSKQYEEELAREREKMRLAHETEVASIRAGHTNDLAKRQQLYEQKERECEQNYNLYKANLEKKRKEVEDKYDDELKR